MIYCFNTNFWFLNPFWYLVELLIFVIRTIRNHLWFIRRISTVNCHFWPLPVPFRNSDWANSALSFRWNKPHFCRLNVTQLQIHRNYLHFFKYFVRQYARLSEYKRINWLSLPLKSSKKPIDFLIFSGEIEVN